MVRDGTRQARNRSSRGHSTTRRQPSIRLRRRVNGTGKVSVWERPRGVLADPADPDGPDSPFPDRAPTGHPEFPVRNIEHVIGFGFPLGLHCEDKDVSPDPHIYAVFVGYRIKLPGADPPEHKIRMPLLYPALQEGRALHLDCRPIGRLSVEVVPADPQRALVSNRPGDQELRKDPARGVVPQIAERPAPEIRNRGIEPCEALGTVQRYRWRRGQPGWSTARSVTGEAYAQAGSAGDDRSHPSHWEYALSAA
jgi:hypothetical protein